MAVYRALRAGQHPDGSGAFLREGQRFVWGGKAGSWMELVEAPSPAQSAPEDFGAVPEPAEPQAEPEPESAPAESKRQLRGRKVAKETE